MKVFRDFYKYVFRHPINFLGYLLFFIIARSTENLQPFFFKWLIGSVGVGDFNHAITLIELLGLALVGGTISHAISWMFGDRGVVKSAVDLQLDVMRQIHNLDFAYHTEKSSGKLISIMKRGEDAFFNMFDIINYELFAVFISIIFMLFAFGSLGAKYVILSLVIIAIAVITSIPLLKANLKRRRAFNDAEDHVSAARVDNLVNFDTVKYFAKEKFEQERLSGLLKTWNNTIQSYLNTYRYFDLSVGNLSNIAIVITILFSIFDLQAGKITVADFVLVSSFSASFFPKLMSVVMILKNGVRRFSDLEAYFEVLRQKSSVIDPISSHPIGTPNGQIRFENVTFHYHSKNPVFKNFSLTVKPGESIALVGISGSGKTTLLKLLMRMYDISSGSIFIDDVNIKKLTKSDLRSLIGIVPQDPLMFNQSLRYNVSYAHTGATDDQVWEALKLAKLDEFVKKLPEGLETKVGERGIKLSGGQRQRLAIARVLLEKAKIIVLDEATSSLDSESEGIVQNAFWGLVKDPKESRTSIIIAHRLSTVMRSDRIIVLDHGKIAEEGTHKQLLKKKNGLYNHLWSLQQNGFLSED